MAGAGAKLFTDGSVLTAAQVNTFLMDQSIMRFATTAARDAAFGGAGEPTLAEGMMCYIDADNSIYTYDGSAWVKMVSASTPPAMELVASGSVSAQNRLNLPSCFSSAYTMYRIIVTPITHSTAGNLILRFSASGTDTLGTGYTTRRNETDSTTNSVVSLAATSSISPTFCNNTANSFVTIAFDVANPFESSYTFAYGQANRIDGGTNLINVAFSGILTDTNSYNGISLIGNTGNITCTMRVYGYRN